MDLVSQMLLRPLFFVLYKILCLTGLYRISHSTEIARYFFESDFRKHKKNNTRRIHWTVFRPQKGEVALSAYNITKLVFSEIIRIGDTYVGSRKREKVAGFYRCTTARINELLPHDNFNPLAPQFWPLPHYRHVNLVPKLTEPLDQLRAQLLAQRLSKTLLNQQTYSTEYF